MKLEDVRIHSTSGKNCFNVNTCQKKQRVHCIATLARSSNFIPGLLLLHVSEDPGLGISKIKGAVIIQLKEFSITKNYGYIFIG